MLSDEEKAKDILINFRKYNKYYKEEKALSITISFELKEALNEAIKVLLTVFEKQSKEIEELKQNIHLKEVYVLKTNDYIKGTNIEDEICNKKWEDKIKAKIEEKFLEAKGLYERGVQPQAQYTMKILRDLEKSLFYGK